LASSRNLFESSDVLPSVNLRRFVWLHLLDKRSVFDAQPDLARPPVPYPLLAVQAVRPDSVIDVYWRKDRQLYLSVERSTWQWCLVAAGRRWQTGELKDGLPSIEEFQRNPRRLSIGGIKRKRTQDAQSIDTDLQPSQLHSCHI
jgi:hypothetical protein